jgi:hypothetical protein
MSKAGTGGYSYIVRPFDCRSLKPPHACKPHLVFVDGWWRVSSMQPALRMLANKPGPLQHSYRIWRMAHNHVAKLNNIHRGWNNAPTH